MVTKRAVLVCLPVLLAGCGVPVQSGSAFSNGWAPGGSSTFSWHDDMEHVQGDARLEDNAFFHARLREAIEWELNLRRIRYSESGAELMVHYHLSFADHELEREVLTELGEVELESVTYQGGSFVIHIEDASVSEDVWFAWAQANVEPAFSGPVAMQNWVYALVGRMFEDWPLGARVAAAR